MDEAIYTVFAKRRSDSLLTVDLFENHSENQDCGETNMGTQDRREVRSESCLTKMFSCLMPKPDGNAKPDELGEGDHDMTASHPTLMSTPDPAPRPRAQTLERQPQLTNQNCHCFKYILSKTPNASPSRCTVMEIFPKTFCLPECIRCKSNVLHATHTTRRGDKYTAARRPHSTSYAFPTCVFLCFRKNHPRTLLRPHCFQLSRVL